MLFEGLKSNKLLERVIKNRRDKVQVTNIRKDKWKTLYILYI